MSQKPWVDKEIVSDKTMVYLPVIFLWGGIDSLYGRVKKGFPEIPPGLPFSKGGEFLHPRGKKLCLSSFGKEGPKIF